MKDEAKKELEKLYRRDGCLNPLLVVSAAKRETSALHEYFQWDDSKAAEQYRLVQARQLIRVAVTVIPALSDKPVRQYVSLSNRRQTGEGSYVATVDVISDDEKYAQAKRDALGALIRLEAQYRHIVELQHIWSAVTIAAEEALITAPEMAEAA